MKKACMLLFLLVLAGLMLQPISSQVNTQPSNNQPPDLNAGSQPMPPSAGGIVLVADAGPKPLCPPACAAPYFNPNTAVR